MGRCCGTDKRAVHRSGAAMLPSDAFESCVRGAPTARGASGGAPSSAATPLRRAGPLRAEGDGSSGAMEIDRARREKEPTRKDGFPL